MSEEKRTRVKTSELIPQIKEIVDITKSLRVIVDNLPDSSVKDAYVYSVVNLETKNDKFLAPDLTDEQKKAIALIRSGKANISAILSSAESGKSAESFTPPKKTGKKNQ